MSYEVRILKLRELPRSDAGGGDAEGYIVEIRGPDRKRVLVEIRPDDPLPERLTELDAAAVAADLLRPGWRVRARPSPVPLLARRERYHTFAFERSSQTPAAPGCRWTVQGLVPWDLQEPFTWTDAAGLLDAWRDDLYRDPGP